MVVTVVPVVAVLVVIIVMRFLAARHGIGRAVHAMWPM